jgi:hypothetical protein
MEAIPSTGVAEAVEETGEVMSLSGTDVGLFA